MDKQVTIRISGSQTTDGQTHTATMTTTGTLHLEEDSFALCYQEWGLMGRPGPLTIHVTPEAVSMNHTEPGHINLMFPRQGHAVNHIATPHGLMAVEVHMHKVRSCVTEHSGELELEYELRNGAYSSIHRMQVAFQ